MSFEMFVRRCRGALFLVLTLAVASSAEAGHIAGKKQWLLDGEILYRSGVYQAAHGQTGNALASFQAAVKQAENKKILAKAMSGLAGIYLGRSRFRNVQKGYALLQQATLLQNTKAASQLARLAVHDNLWPGNLRRYLPIYMRLATARHNTT